MKSFLLSLSLLLLLTSCHEHIPYRYTISALQLYNADNAGSRAVDAASASIPAKAYAIRLEYTNQIEPKDGQDDESRYQLLYPVQSFTVTSLTDFDNAHPANSQLNDYFLYGAYSSTVGSGSTIPAQLASGAIGLSYGAGIASPVPATWKASSYLVLMRPPAYFGNRSFVVHIGFANNAFVSDTITVNLLP